MRKGYIAIFLFVITMLLLIVFIDQMYELTDNIKFTIIVGIGTIASGVSAIFMSYSAIRTSQFEAIKEYFLKGDSFEMTECRGKMYEYEKGNIPFDKIAASALCNHYHFWGMMVYRRHLPIWVFESASGPSICRLYVIMEDYIQEKRTHNKNYAYHFETLVNKIDKKYKYKQEFLVERRKSKNVKTRK